MKAMAEAEKRVSCKLLLYSGCCRQRQQKQLADASGHAGCIEQDISGRLGKLFLLKAPKSQNVRMAWLGKDLEAHLVPIPQP